MNQQFSVYEVWDLEKEKVFYVGKCKNVSERHIQHLKKMRSKDNGPAFLKKLKSMIAEGKPYEMRVVYTTIDEKSAFEEEIRLIALYGRYDKNTGTLLNHTDGGEGTTGRVMSQEVRAKWSEQRKGKKPWNKGVKGYNLKSSRKKRGWSSKQREIFESRSEAEKESIKQKRRNSLAKRTTPSEAQIKAAKDHSERMKGSNNPNYGKVGYYAGRVGPRKGMSSPIKGKKKGSDGKMYDPSQLLGE